jgi:hypothetical protein
MQQCIKILLFIILNKAQHVSRDTPPIIKSLKLHKQLLVSHMWKVVGRAVVGRAVVGRCQLACSALHPLKRYLTTSKNLPLMKNQRLLMQF